MPKTIADFVSISKPKTIADYVKVNGSNTANQSAFTNSTESTVPKVQQEQKDNGGFLGGIGYSLEKIGLGFLSGIEGIWDFAAGGLAKLFGADDWAEQQIANDWVNYNHADEWFNPSEGWQVVGDVAGGIGTSLPAMAGVAAAGIATAASGGTLAPVAATLIAGSISGLGAAGRATKEAYDQTGELTGKEFGYGALSGFTEGAIEGVSTLIGAGTGAAVKGIAKSFGKEVAKSASRQTLLKGIVKGFAGEAFEEGVQTIVEPYYKRMTYDPNAENATMQEVAYAALVGGLSGALMGGGDVAVRNIRGTSRGNTLVTEGRANDVITTAEQISAYQTENQTDYETFQVVQNTLNELKTSLEKTGGEVRTVRQKMLLGTLEQANTSAAFEPIVTASAENIYNNAEAVAARLNELGYQDQNGKPIHITAEQIREGIDTTDAKSFRKTMSNALKTNSVLRTLAVADTVGQISMDTARFKDATLSGQKLFTQADLNRFIEQATDAERQAVAERLGIDNWETLTNEQFRDKITEFVANGGVQQYQQERNLVKEAQSIAPETAKKHLPRMVNLSNDGTYRYTQGGTDIAITKRGDSYYIYDYESGLMSKALTRTETNRVLREIYTNEQNYQEGVRRHTEQQNKLREQAAELDTYARENIADYKNLSAAGQASIRATIRQGRAAGVQADFVLSCARVSARSGLRVVFSKEASFVAANGSYADGAIDLKNNRIIINPEAKSRSGESILIHELTHAIYNDTDGTLTVAEGLETMKEAEKEKIRKRYSAIGQGSALEVSDEINAHFAEQTLSNKNILERLIEKKATLKDKILGFFKKARTDYKGDEKLTGAAARLYRQYKKLFDEFSARNQRYLGTENASADAQAQAAKRGRTETIRFSLMNNRSFEDNVQDILTMSDSEARVNVSEGNFVSVMKHTPDVILNNVEGAQDLEVIIRFDALYLASRADGIVQGHYHDLGVEITKRLPQLISDPDAIVRMDNGRLNILAEMKTDKGSNGIISIELNTVKDINSKNTKYNLVVSAFSAKDNYVRNTLQKRAERVEYTKKDLSQVNHQLYEWLATINERSNLKQSTSPTPDVQAPSLTSETGRRIKTTSTSSISQNAENVNPESQNGRKYALPDTYSSEDGNSRSRSNYSAGQRARFVANNTGMRVYNRAEAAEVINSIIEERLVFEDIGMQGELRGKDRQAVIDYLFQKLNTVKEGYRGGVALRIADYMIERTVLTDMYSDSTGEVSDAMHRLSVLRGYMHKIDLRGIQDEIRYRFDKKNSINLVWGAKEGGIAPDTLPQLLADEGIFIDETNAADSFLQMVDMYEEARTTVNNATEKVKLTTYGDATTIKNLRQQIARDILNAYVQKGSKSKYAKLVEKYTKQIADLKQRLSESNANNRLINSIVDQAQKMRDLKLGTFLNSSQYKSEVFKNSIEALGKIKFRGNFNISGTRKIMADLRTWYTKENPLLTDSYEQGIADMLDEVANGTKSYSRSELQTINRLMAYFTNFVEKFNKVYRQGKWVDAIPEATRYIETIHNNEQVKVGLFRKIAGSTYMQTFGDPMTVARRMDMYERGFYTEMLTELREAAIDADVTEMEIRQNYDDFMNRNKKYLSQSAKQTVEYRGVDVPKMHLISLYMTLKRTHAQAGLAQNGFAFTDADGKRVRVDGFAPEITDASELRAAAIEEQAAIAKLLTETDKEYIAILEKAFNEDAKKLKADRDMQRLGFTNATEDYYYPIRRGNIAKNVDTSDIQGELDRVSSASFNKDTVRGAKQELYIESADTVFNRHIHAVAQYAALSPAIETYNKLYNLDIGGNANKPISVATESANIWPKGNQYFSKLISDIQGIQSTPTEGMQLLGRVRGNYAKFQLGANPKVWVTQLSSLFAASNMLDASSISRGMFISANDVDTYCPLAKLRAQDNTAAMAQGVLDKVGKFSDILMAPIGKMDRFVVRRLFGACQVQIQKYGGAAIGTEANKIEAGKLLKNVILETQQNSLATERSAAMRSGNEILRTLTMFSADSMKAIGRVIDSIGELSTLRAKLRMTTDTARQSELKAQIKTARKKVFKSMTALTTSAMFMVGVAQLFKWLYNKDQDDEEPAAQQILVDFVGNLLGGLPLLRDLYSRIAEGYSVDNYAYSALNDLLDSVVNIFDTVGSFVTGEESSSKLSARVKNLINALGQITGIPTRNLYNVFYGLTKRISPTTAYKIDEFFYTKNYVSDLNKAIENDDTDMMAMLMSMIFGERMGNTNMNDSVRDKFIDLYSKGYSVLPRSIGDTISYGGVDISLSEEEYSRFHSIYAQAMKDLNKMVSSSSFNALSEELQAKAIKQVYDAYYYDALTDLVGVDERTTVGELADAIDMSKLSVAVAGLSNITSDKNASGQTVSGSKKKNTIKYLLGQDLSDGERLLILCYRGYSIQDGDYKGYTATRAKQILLRYILKLNISQAEKAAIAQKCGFSVRNNRIIRDF